MGEKKDSFRYTVQFNAGDPSHQQVAAILNEQGRRKAQFLVNAVTHYMNCPETPEAAAAPRIDRQTVEQLVREILSNMHPEPVPAMGEDRKIFPVILSNPFNFHCHSPHLTERSDEAFSVWQFSSAYRE